MEEMNNVLETGVNEIIEETTEKVTFGQNLTAYALAGTFVIGVAAIGYLGYKGIKKLSCKFNDKNTKVEDSNEEVVDVEEHYIHVVNDDETENK